MADKLQVLTGYSFQGDPALKEAMLNCIEAQHFIPLIKRGIYSKERAEAVNEIVKKRRGK